MKKAYFVFGTLICLLFAYATYARVSVLDSLKSGKWGPQGRSAYHK